MPALLTRSVRESCPALKPKLCMGELGCGRAASALPRRPRTHPRSSALSPGTASCGEPGSSRAARGAARERLEPVAAPRGLFKG